MFNPICVCTAFLALAAYFFPSQGARLIYHNEGSLPDELDTMELYLAADPTPTKRNDKTKVAATSGLWFGPRLGRRKRTNENGIGDDLSLAQDEALVRLLQDGPWAMLSLKGGKRRSVNFTPRLGRESEENLLENFVDSSLGEYAGRSPLRSGGQGTPSTGGSNFTPRLGRLAPPNNDLQQQQQQH